MSAITKLKDPIQFLTASGFDFKNIKASDIKLEEMFIKEVSKNSVVYLTGVLPEYKESVIKLATEAIKLNPKMSFYA